MEQYF